MRRLNVILCVTIIASSTNTFAQTGTTNGTGVTVPNNNVNVNRSNTQSNGIYDRTNPNAVVNTQPNRLTTPPNAAADLSNPNNPNNPSSTSNMGNPDNPNNSSGTIPELPAVNTDTGNPTGTAMMPAPSTETTATPMTPAPVNTNPSGAASTNPNNPNNATRMNNTTNPMGTHSY